MDKNEKKEKKKFKLDYYSILAISIMILCLIVIVWNIFLMIKG
jgi:preprotein translocase subunit Sec61beta